MVIIQGSVGAGKTTELVKKFMLDPNEALIIVTEERIKTIEDRVDYLRSQGWKMNNPGMKHYASNSQTTLVTNILEMIEQHPGINLYIDAASVNNEPEFLELYKDLEEEHNIKITITQQLKRNSEIAGLNIIE